MKFYSFNFMKKYRFNFMGASDVARVVVIVATLCVGMPPGHAGRLVPRGVLGFFASMLAPTEHVGLTNKFPTS
jgi:hypothetical protein